jgi:type I restriction enzyme M protein
MDVTFVKRLKLIHYLRGQSPGYVHKMLQKAAGQQFYNTSKYDFAKLKAVTPTASPKNLLHYVHGFSSEVRTLFEHLAPT